jgi:hypothetical protein
MVRGSRRDCEKVEEMRDGIMGGGAVESWGIKARVRGGYREVTRRGELYRCRAAGHVVAAHV